MDHPRTGRGTGLRGAVGAAAAILTLTCGAAVADEVRDGDKALDDGRLDQALRYYQAAASFGRAEGHAGIGHVRLRQGRLEDAAQAFGRALEMDPELAGAHYGQGAVLKHQERCAEATPRFERAVALDRKFPEAQLALGECLVATGQIDRAVAELGKGLKWGREWSPRFLAARGAAWMARDSLRLAAADFTRAREMAPRDASIRRAIGHFYIERGTWALAIPELETAVALDSSDAEAQYELARALFYDRRYDEALETYRRLTNRYPEHALARLGMGDLLYRAGDADPGRYAEAKAQLQQYVRLEPRDAKGWGLLGRTLHRLGEADSALAALEEAERLGEKNPESYLAMGLLYADRRDWERARATLERGQPGPREQKILAQIYEFTGHPGQADSLYVAALARDSTSADAAFVHRQRAKLRFRARNYAEAESLFARSIALDPGSGESWFYRGLCLKEMDQPDSSFLALRRAAEIDTAKADRFFWLGVVLDSRKQPDEAADAFRRAVEIDSTGELASRSFRQLGYYSLLERQWGTAIRWLERAAALDPEDAQTWLWMGQGHQNAGRREEAAKCYRRALSLDPDNVGAKKGLEVLGIGLVEPRGKEIPTATLERGNRAARRGATGRSEDERAHSRAGSGESRRA